jgi:hypothetical protein
VTVKAMKSGVAATVLGSMVPRLNSTVSLPSMPIGAGIDLNEVGE